MMMSKENVSTLRHSHPNVKALSGGWKDIIWLPFKPVEVLALPCPTGDLLLFCIEFT